MDEAIYKGIQNYFTLLETKGYVKESIWLPLVGILMLREISDYE
jgi:hypothetical protein